MGASPSKLPPQGAKTLLREYKVQDKGFVWYKEFGVNGKLTSEESFKLVIFMSYEMPSATEKLLKFLDVDGCVLRRDLIVFGPTIRLFRTPDFETVGALSVANAKQRVESSHTKARVNQTAQDPAWKLAAIPKTRRAVSRRLKTLKARCPRATPFYISINIIPIGSKTGHRNFVILNPAQNTITWIEPGAAVPWMNNPTYNTHFRAALLQIAAELGMKSPTLLEPDLADGEKLYRKTGSDVRLPKGWKKTSWIYRILTGFRYYSEEARVSVRNKPRTGFLLPQFIVKDLNCTFWTYFILMHLLLNPSIKSPKGVIEMFYKVYDTQAKSDLLEYIENFKFFLYHKLFGPERIEKAIERLNQRLSPTS